MLHQTQVAVVAVVLSLLYCHATAACAPLVVNVFGPSETTTRNALGQLSGDDATLQAVSIVDNKLIAQTREKVPGLWYTDLNSSCQDVSPMKLDTLEVVWSNSAPVELSISVMWGASDDACKTRTWTETTSASQGGALGNVFKTSTVKLDSMMQARIHAILLGFKALDYSTTYTIQSVKLLASDGSCSPTQVAKGTSGAFTLGVSVFAAVAVFAAVMLAH